jgi:hypothetical protein
MQDWRIPLHQQYYFRETDIEEFIRKRQSLIDSKSQIIWQDGKRHRERERERWRTRDMELDSVPVN